MKNADKFRNNLQRVEGIRVASSIRNEIGLVAESGDDNFNAVESRLLEQARDVQNSSSYRMFELSRLFIT